MRQIRRTIRLISILFALFVMASTVYASSEYPPIDKNQTGNLTIIYEGEGAVFQLYRIADVSESAEFILNPEYAAYSPDPISSLALTEQGWSDLAEALGTSLRNDQKSAEYTVTIQNGKANLSGIPLGLYLLLGDPVTRDNVTYHPIPTFIMVPEWGDGQWLYAFEAEPKKWKETIPSPEPSSKPISYSVRKEWKGDNSSIRPREITAAIYQGDHQVKTVVLNESNNWCYTWSDAEGGEPYSVRELNIPDHYSLVMTGTDTEFVLLNVYQGKPPYSPGTGDFHDTDMTLVVFIIAMSAVLSAGAVLLYDRIQGEQ